MVEGACLRPVQVFPGHLQMKPERPEIERLRREVNKLKADRDILKEPLPTSRRKRYDVRLNREVPERLAGGTRSNGSIAVRFPCLAAAPDPDATKRSS